MSRRKAAIATFAGSTATTFVVAIQAIALMPLYLHEIGPRLYGAWLATGELLVLMLAFDAGIPNLMIQRIGAALAKRDYRAVGAYFGTGGAVLFAFALCLGLLLFGASSVVPSWVHISGAEAQTLSGAFLVSSAAMSVMLINYLFQGLARGLQDTVLINAASLAGAVIGFALTLAMLLAGYGLWSIAAGVAARSAVTLVGGIAFLLFRVDKSIYRSIRFDRSVGREFLKLSPPLFASGLGQTLMNNSQVFLAAALLGPQSAAVLGITRKAAEMAGMILNAVGYAAYGGFSNLYASGNRIRSRAVYAEVISVYLSIGLALLCAYMAVNPSLVKVWAGPDMFGGPFLTGLLAVATLVSGWSALTMSLYRSMDRHRSASAAVLIECACRLPLLVGLALILGLPGLALGTIATSLVSGLWAHHQISSALPRLESLPARVWLVRGGIFGLGLAVCILGGSPSWAFVLAAGSIFVLFSGLLLLHIDPLLQGVRQMLGRRFAGVRP